MKKILKKVLPRFVVNFLIRRKLQFELIQAYRYDYKRYYRYSGTNGYTDRTKLEGLIIKTYHIVEKGLTMPEPRLGFGKDKIELLASSCITYLDKYQITNQVEHAIGVLLEYAKFHSEKKYTLDKEIKENLNKIDKLAKEYKITNSNQITIAREEYFNAINSDFSAFSNSRKSVRNYSVDDTISDETITNVLNLAQNTPSACNRQTARVYIFSDKEKMEQIFDVQNGNRGFGHLADKLVVITVETGVFAFPLERNQAYIDGGMYAMNILYSLHYHQVAACILNCSNTPKVDREMRKVCGIKASEQFIAMISCGIAPTNFSIATSPRYNINSICTQ